MFMYISIFLVKLNLPTLEKNGLFFFNWVGLDFFFKEKGWKLIEIQNNLYLHATIQFLLKLSDSIVILFYLIGSATQSLSRTSGFRQSNLNEIANIS